MIPKWHPALCRGCGMYLVRYLGTCLCGTVRVHPVIVPDGLYGYVQEVTQNRNNSN